MITTFGTIGKESTHIDTSKTLRGAKIYATKNGYKTVSKRTGYYAEIVEIKINEKWEKFDFETYKKLKKL